MFKIYTEDFEVAKLGPFWDYDDEDIDYPGPDAPWDAYPPVGQYTSEDLEFLIGTQLQEELGEWID